MASGTPKSVLTNGIFTDNGGGVNVSIVAQTGLVNCINFQQDVLITAVGNITSQSNIVNATITLDICDLQTTAVIYNLLNKTVSLSADSTTTLNQLNNNTPLSFKYDNGSYLLRLMVSYSPNNLAISYYGITIGYVPSGYTLDTKTNISGNFTGAFAELLNKLGKYIYIEDGSMPCPNCKTDKVSGRSINKYNESNPYPVTSEYNKRFPQGAQCSVCGGTSKIIKWTKIRGLANWQTQNPDYKLNVQLSARKCEVKVPKIYYNLVRQAQNIRIETVDGTYVTCSIENQPTGFGINTHEFVVFYANAIT